MESKFRVLALLIIITQTIKIQAGTLINDFDFSGDWLQHVDVDEQNLADQLACSAYASVNPTDQNPEFQILPVYSQAASIDTSGSNRLLGYSFPSIYYGDSIISDDWIDNTNSSIMGIRWWGSFANWSNKIPPANKPDAFHIGIWTNRIKPADDAPATLVWEYVDRQLNWNISQNICNTIDIEGPDETVFEFICMLPQNQWFNPGLVKGTRYWLSISAVYDSRVIPTQYVWGWLSGSTDTDTWESQAYPILGLYSTWPPELGSRDKTPLQINDTFDMAFELLSRDMPEDPCTDCLTIEEVLKLFLF